MPTSNTNTREIESLYRQFGPALLLFASAMTGERGRAQDAVHHVLLRLMEDGNLGHDFSLILRKRTQRSILENLIGKLSAVVGL